MALSDARILKHRKKGNIVISPFNRKDLSTSSYDVRLGKWFYREQRPPKRRSSRDLIFNPYNKDDVVRVWGKPQQAATLWNVLKKFYPTLLKTWDEEKEGIWFDDLVIPIDQGETILGHTLEFIGGLNCVTTSMQARSSQGRSFLEVCKCAGWGDVGYINRWTMEITNNSQYRTIFLVVGRRYAQIIFPHTGPVLDTQYGKNGKYQSGSNLKEIKKNWTPDMMLPKLYTDRDRIKKKS